ncbi:hypothetical protein [Citricoccus nitrophenolicus]|uniref:hypothetical protein n=2 Tax=Citricoccus nitrophenolicus TaxID=863575 RepID=UPI0031EE061D
MRTTRFTLILVGLVALVVLLTIGIVYALNRSAEPDAAEATPTTVETATARSAGPTDAATGRAWQTTTPAPALPSSSTPSTTQLDREAMSAEELVTTAAQVMTTWDTTIDVSPTDGYRRALPLFVDEYKDIFVVPAKPALPEDWWEAAEHDATSTPQVQITDTYPQGETTVYYVVAHWTWESDDGFELKAGPTHMTFQVAQDDIGFVIENWTQGQLQ